MQKALSLQSGLFPVRHTTEVADVAIPWEVAGYSEDYFAAESGGGVFDLSHWAFLRLAGPDARDYLQRMSTVNFKAFDAGRATPGAFLTGRAGVVSLGWFLGEGPDRFLILVEGSLRETTREHVEKFHFAERFTSEDATGEWAVFGLWAPSPPLRDALGLSTEEKPLEIRRVQLEWGALAAWRDDCRPALFWITMERKLATAWLEWLRTFSVPLLGHRLFEFYRLAAGVPAVGTEVTERDIILEAAQDRAVARNKGCYPGQEVVERIYTYGQVNRRLTRLELKGEIPESFRPLSLAVEGKEAGTVVAFQATPENPFRAAALAYVRRPFWDHEGPFDPVEGLEASLVR